MPYRLLAALFMLLFWPIQVGLIGVVDSWIEPVGIWTRLAVPLIFFVFLIGLFGVASMLIVRYCESSHPARRLHDSLSQWLSPRGYQWLPIVAGALALGAVAFTLYLTIWDHFVNLTPMLVVALVGIWDLTKPPAIQLNTDPLPQPRMDFLPPDPQPEGGKAITVRWSADFDETTTAHSAEMSIPEHEYQAYRSRKRQKRRPLSNYGHYVSEGLSPSVHSLAGQLRAYTTLHGLTSLEEALCGVSLARSIPYASDTETRHEDDWADYPVELLYDERGDCEDHAILAAAVLHLLGHIVALYWIKLEDCGHIALGYHAPFEIGPLVLADEHGIEYLYVETVPVSGTYHLGEIPSEFLAELRDSRIINISTTNVSSLS